MSRRPMSPRRQNSHYAVDENILDVANIFKLTKTLERNQFQFLLRSCSGTFSAKHFETYDICQLRLNSGVFDQNQYSKTIQLVLATWFLFCFSLQPFFSSSRNGMLVAFRRQSDLVDIGRRMPITNGKRYKVGTHFIHNQLGYRGKCSNYKVLVTYLFTRGCSISLGCRNGGSQPDVVLKNLLPGKNTLKRSTLLVIRLWSTLEMPMIYPWSLKLWESLTKVAQINGTSR